MNDMPCVKPVRSPALRFRGDLTRLMAETLSGVYINSPTDFPGGSDGKASAYNVGSPGSIPESGRSPGEGNGNPLQYSCLENPMDGGAWWATVHGVPELDTTERLHFPLDLLCAGHGLVDGFFSTPIKQEDQKLFLFIRDRQEFPCFLPSVIICLLGHELPGHSTE